jgi:hypothetical protein
MQSHAQAPVVLPLDGNDYRAYFASRDAENRSHVNYVDFDITDPAATAEFPDEPVLAPGPLGYFDDHGTYPSGMVVHEGRHYLFYIGWSPGKTQPLFYASIGLAVSEDGGLSFERVRRAPVLGRSEEDPWMVTGPSVILDDGTWRMWYVSGLKWGRQPDGSLISWYHIKSATSADAIAWEPDGRVCIGHEHRGERNIGRPCVLKEEGTYRCWYPYSGDAGYRLGYAESPDGLEWTRMDETFELTGSPGEWDDEAQVYPFVFRHEERRYMAYNGNSYGRTGFGLAVEE